MLPPELLRLVGAFLTQHLSLQELTPETLCNPSAALACTHKTARDAVGFRSRLSQTTVIVTGPDRLFKNWLRIEPQTDSDVLQGECVGHVMQKLLLAWMLPPSFFACGLDMRAPVPRHVHVAVDLAPLELIVIVDNYLRFPYEKFISKLHKHSYTAELRKMFPAESILLRDSFDGQVLLLDAV
jgi:hypothetical protein